MFHQIVFQCLLERALTSTDTSAAGHLTLGVGVWKHKCWHQAGPVGCFILSRGLGKAGWMVCLIHGALVQFNFDSKNNVLAEELHLSGDTVCWVRWQREHGAMFLLTPFCQQDIPVHLFGQCHQSLAGLAYPWTQLMECELLHSLYGSCAFL